MLMVMIVATALLLIVVVMMVRLFQHLLLQRAALRHGCQNLFSRQLVPGRCDDGRLRVALSQKLHTFLHFILRNLLRTAQNDGSRVFNLIIIELPEVLHIHLAFRYIGNRDTAANLDSFHLRSDSLYRLHYIRKFSHA